MVRVFKCHSFASQHVIPLSKEPLMACAENDKVFVASSDCEIIVFQVSNGTSVETQRCPTISQVEKLAYNSCKNYIATIELKKTWKRLTKSVRVYLNWESNTPGSTKPRTKVRVAGKSHVQHISSSPKTDLMEIVEVPLDDNATGLAVCRCTGNFAIACGSEVKLCSVVEKTVANSDKIYLDVEVFLELCWNFPVQYISIYEEFVLCCSQKEVQGIRIKFTDGDKSRPKRYKTRVSQANQSFYKSDQDLYSHTVETSNLHTYSSESFLHLPKKEGDVQVGNHIDAGLNSSDMKPIFRTNSDIVHSTKDYSAVGMGPSPRESIPVFIKPQENSSTVVDDENFQEWIFQKTGNNTTVYLPSLHTSLSTQTQTCLHPHVIAPPVLSDFSGGRVKSISGIQAETILYLNDSLEKEEWISIILIPSYSSVQPAPLRKASVSTNRMRSLSGAHRTSVCCYISGTRGGYLYQISPQMTHVTSYKYTDKAVQVSVSQSYLHVVTCTGIETYTSRWQVVSLEEQNKEDDKSVEKIHPQSSLDVCLCGHEPFIGATSLSVGTDFLTLMSKVEDDSSSEVHWSLYVLHTFNLVELYKDMLRFADKIKVTGPSSYIHLLQEAHLLLVTNPLFTETKEPEVLECYKQVCNKLGEYYSLPGQDDWFLCWPYYTSSGTSIEDIVKTAVEQTNQTEPKEYGRGLINCLDHFLVSNKATADLPAETCNEILNVYAVSAPDKLSQVILFSEMKLLSPDIAFQHLKLWLSKKASDSHQISTVDKLAMVQLHLIRCEVDDACSMLSSVQKSSLVDVCSSHSNLIYDNANTFTPLSQLMRQHMSGTLLEILIEMMDRSVMSLDCLLILLKSQLDLPNNNHVRELLEMILSDDKRALQFEKAAQMLCEIYIAKLKDNTQPSTKQVAAIAHHKFSLPQGNGYFAPRFAWLDYLPPFQGPTKMARPCQRLEVKPIPGQGSRSASMPVTVVTRQISKEKCQCPVCNENLLKLQSLLCSPRLTPELATFVLNQVNNHNEDDQINVKDSSSDECWDSVSLLCLVNLDLEKAVDLVMDRHVTIIGMFAVSCFNGNVDKYGKLLRSLEMVIKSCAVTKSFQNEELYVKAYKDLLLRMAELFHPATFVDLLPPDANLFFLLPYLCTSLKLDHTDKLKQKIVDMGKDLVSHN